MNDMPVFNKGDQVPEAGEYVCSPCGYHHHFEEGDTFTECTSCLAGSEAGDDEHVDGTGLWEKAEK